MDRKLQLHRADSLRQHGFLVLITRYRPSVCPSVCPSHGCIIEKRLKLGL